MPKRSDDINAKHRPAASVPAESEKSRTAASAQSAAPHASSSASKAPKPTVASKARVKVGGAADSGNEENNASARKGAIFLAFVVVAYVVFLIISGQMDQFIDALGGINMHWVILAALCFVLYFAFGVTAYVIAVYIDHDSPVGVRDLMSVEASGVFFGNLTPMQAGSIPSQIYRLTKTGLDVGEASATQFTRFIAFQFGVVLFAALMLVAKLEYFMEAFGAVFYFNIFIFGIHFLELAALFVVCLCPGFVRRVGNWAINFCDRHGWLKDRAHWDDMVNVQVQEFSDAFKRAFSDLPSMLLTLLVTMAQLGSLYMIPWFVGRAFGVEGDFLECLAAGSMVQLVSTAIPLPGGTGGAEGSFAMFYSGLFGDSITAGFLVWRLITFIVPTILAAPLLSLRSNSSESIYHRCQRFIHQGRPASIQGERSIGARLRSVARPRGGATLSVSTKAPGAAPHSASAKTASRAASGKAGSSGRKRGSSPGSAAVSGTSKKAAGAQKTATGKAATGQQPVRTAKGTSTSKPAKKSQSASAPKPATSSKPKAGSSSARVASSSQAQVAGKAKSANTSKNSSTHKSKHKGLVIRVEK